MHTVRTTILLCRPFVNLSGRAMEYERAGAAKRRRERRLRSWWRHERMTVAAELAVALHHSRDVGPGSHVGLRAQRTASSGGRRPGVLKEPEPPVVVEHAACPCSGAPSLLPPSLADAAADVVDHSSLAFLLKASLRQRRKEEEEEARKVEMEQVLAVKEQWRARRKVLEDEFMALLNLESRSSLQERRLPGTLGCPGRPRCLQAFLWFL